MKNMKFELLFSGSSFQSSMYFSYILTQVVLVYKYMSNRGLINYDWEDSCL